jgi:hypothetical protein
MDLCANEHYVLNSIPLGFSLQCFLQTQAAADRSTSLFLKSFLL